MRISDIGWDNTPKSLLTSRVPELQFVGLATFADYLREEIDAYCCLCLWTGTYCFSRKSSWRIAEIIDVLPTVGSPNRIIFTLEV